MKNIPFLLILLRLTLAPIMLSLSFMHMEYVGIFLFVLLFVGILSDVLDGVIARKLKISTDNLRKWDSNVDVFFLLSCIGSAWILYPNLVEAKLPFILCILGSELFMYVVSLIRFKRLPSNHAYSSKLFALSIFVCLSTLFLSDDWGITFYIMFVIGILSYLDNILILLRLSSYKVDTKVFWQAK